jgi:hypothetical protein
VNRTFVVMRVAEDGEIDDGDVETGVSLTEARELAEAISGDGMEFQVFELIEVED